MKRIAVLFAEGFEEVEAVTAVDFLRRAGLVVSMVGVTGKEVTGSHGITVTTDLEAVETEPGYDAVVIPGGMPGAKNIADSESARALVSSVSRAGGLVAAICAAPAVVLSSWGLLEGKEATCYPGYEKELRNASFSDKRVVVDGNLITSRGPGTAAEFAEAVIAYLVGKEEAEKLHKTTLQHA